MARRTVPKPDVEDAIIDAALRLAAERPWRLLGLAEIAAAAGLDPAQLYRVFASKPAILAGLARRVDEAALAGVDEAGGSARDRLFDRLMRRFEALAPHRPALRKMLCRPGLDALPLALRLPRSMAWMLEAAGTSAGGLAGLVRVKLLGLAYLAALRSFLRDETADLAPTMAALDRALRRVEPFLRLAEPPPAEPAPAEG